MSKKKKKGLHRTENGRLSRSKENKELEERLKEEEEQMTEAEALSVGVDARQRHHGITEHEARRSTSGYLLGRLLDATAFGENKEKGISRTQHDAGMRYAEVKYLYSQIMQGPAQPTALDVNRVIGRGLAAQDEEVYANRVQRLTTAYMGAIGAIGGVDEFGLEIVHKALDDQGLNKDELGILRVCLNALDRFFTTGQRYD